MDAVPCGCCRINAEFGLTPEQLDRLNPAKREQVQKSAAMGSG